MSPRPHGAPDRQLREFANALARALGISRTDRRPLHLIQRLVADGYAPTRYELTLAMQMVSLARAEVDTAEVRLIEAARQTRMSWSDIAAGLGLASRQAAEQRYLRLRASVMQAEGRAVHRKPETVRRARLRDRQRLALLDESRPHLERLARWIIEDSRKNPERWDAPQAGIEAPADRPAPSAALATRLAILRRTAFQSGMRTEDLYQLLVDLTKLRKPHNYQQFGQLPPALQDDLEWLDDLEAKLAGL